MDNYNIALSQRRANAVRDYLVQRDYQSDRIHSRGLGEDYPIADNGTGEDRGKNSRVEIIIEREALVSQNK
jgi:outer membrane protein OmpA-like peptidoglycan-associated protein